jgi:uncharacterized protein YhaN
MSNELRFTSVNIRRMPGFETGFRLASLQPGINVVYGPNASGKTTSVTALNAVLWPKRAPARAEVTTHFTLGDSSWLIDLIGDSRQCQKDGRPHDPPPLPPVEGSERYTLSLHSLLRVDDAPFAMAIARETAGGYDIAAAAQVLGALDSATSRSMKQTKDLADADRAMREARDRQEALQAEEDQLSALRRERQKARQAQQQVELLQQAILLVEAGQERREAEARLSTFPEAMDRLAETDADQLAELESTLTGEQAALREHERNSSVALSEMQECVLPEDGVTAGLLTTLREKGRTLGQLAEQMRALQREVDGATKKMLEAQRRINEAVDEHQLQQLDTVALGELAGFARQAEVVRARLQGVEQTRRWLAPSGMADDLEELRQGRMLLARWLRMRETDQPWPGWLPWLLLATGMILLVESVMLVAQGLWPFVLGALLGSALAVTAVILLMLGFAKRASPRQYLRVEYGRLDLDQPGEWTEEDVLLNLEELERRITDADIEAERTKRRKELEEEARLLAEQQERFEQRRVALVEQFGLAPDAAENVDEAVLYLLAENVNRWQVAAQEKSAASSEMSSANDQYAQTLGEINQLLAPYDYQSVAAAEEALAYIENLAERDQRYVTAQTKLESARTNVIDTEARVKKLKNDIERFFEARDIERGDKITLRQRLDRLADFKASQKAAETAALKLQHAAAAVESHPELEGLSRGVLEAALAEAEDKAGSLEHIVERIGRIEERVAMARAGSELGDALARREEAARTLRSRREREYEAVTAGVLVAYVKRETAEQTRPAVFRRARDLFARITHGKYELLLDEEGSTFRARDTITGLGHSLDELSSATRVQLLMAVRLAFVEEQEPGIKLPLFFDETLGNSDEERARAIIQTAMEMASQGRQIFYFTAQLDEVEKWRGIAEEGNGQETHFINLAEARQLTALERLPMPSARLQRAEVPKPDGMDYADYAAALNVPGIDPATTDVDGVHVWHIFDDGETLYRVIRNNIFSCGQLRAFAELSGIGTIGIDEAQYERAAAAARAIEVALQCWREGRGKPVDRHVLIDSGQVSSTHIDATTALATELGRDGLALVEALKAGRIARFWSSKRERLREYLEENGYIDHRDRLSPDEIRLRVGQALSREIQAGVITGARVDELAGRVAAYEVLED